MDSDERIKCATSESEVVWKQLFCLAGWSSRLVPLFVLPDTFCEPSWKVHHNNN